MINKGKKISIFKQHENLTLARNSARYFLKMGLLPVIFVVLEKMMIKKPWTIEDIRMIT